MDDRYNYYTGLDSDGYDKYGYDKSGYDKYGYDKYGYDEYGWDKDGYGKDGFPRWGDYDKYGYNRDGQNADGFDKTGHDRQGNYCDYQRTKEPEEGGCLIMIFKEVKYDNPILNDQNMLNVAKKHLGSLDQAIEIGNLLDREIFESGDNDLLLAGIESFLADELI